ncbi:MAG TPA: c-type cytochrome [Steroidobacteraceae bacterium]|nr:c-type cytochrome [Steroidobacteraceae bacterium]
MKRPYPRCVRALPALLTLAILGIAHAADGSRLYAPCGVCHAPKAWGSPDGVIPNLAGQQKRYLEKQLAVFSSGARVDLAMQVVTAHPTFDNPDNIVTLASYLSKLDANPHPVKGSGEHLRLGQELYTHICSACHGIEGGGEPGNRVPRIAGQHYPYLRRQIEEAAALHRDLAPPEMTSALRGMRPQEKDALADYISRLGDSEALLDLNRSEGAR